MKISQNYERIRFQKNILKLTRNCYATINHERFLFTVQNAAHFNFPSRCGSFAVDDRDSLMEGRDD